MLPQLWNFPSPTGQNTPQKSRKIDQISEISRRFFIPPFYFLHLLPLSTSCITTFNLYSTFIMARTKVSLIIFIHHYYLFTPHYTIKPFVHSIHTVFDEIIIDNVYQNNLMYQCYFYQFFVYFINSFVRMMIPSSLLTPLYLFYLISHSILPISSIKVVEIVENGLQLPFATFVPSTQNSPIFNIFIILTSTLLSTANRS